MVQLLLLEVEDFLWILQILILGLSNQGTSWYLRC